MPKDPVRNMDVDETTAKYISEYKEKKYFFLRSWPARRCSTEIPENSLKPRIPPNATELLVANFVPFWPCGGLTAGGAFLNKMERRSASVRCIHVVLPPGCTWSTKKGGNRARYLTITDITEKSEQFSLGV